MTGQGLSNHNLLAPAFDIDDIDTRREVKTQERIVAYSFALDKGSADGIDIYFHRTADTNDFQRAYRHIVENRQLIVSDGNI